MQLTGRSRTDTSPVRLCSDLSAACLRYIDIDMGPRLQPSNLLVIAGLRPPISTPQRNFYSSFLYCWLHNGPVLFCWLSSVTLPADEPGSCRARGRSARRRPGACVVGRPTLHGGPVVLRPVKATLFSLSLSLVLVLSWLSTRLLLGATLHRSVYTKYIALATLRARHSAERVEWRIATVSVRLKRLNESVLPTPGSLKRHQRKTGGQSKNIYSPKSPWIAATSYTSNCACWQCHF